MSHSLQACIRAHFVEAAGATVKLLEIVHGYKAGLPKPEAARWTRSRVVAELVAGGYTVASNEVGVTVVCGLASLVPIAVRDGRLVA